MLVVKNPPAKASKLTRRGFDPWVGKIPWRRKWQPTPALLPRKFRGLRSLVGYSPWGHQESDTNERLYFTSLQRTRCLWASFGTSIVPTLGLVKMLFVHVEVQQSQCPYTFPSHDTSSSLG